MSWFTSSIRDSIYSLLGSSRPGAITEEHPAVSADDIREAMLELIKGVQSERAAHVVRRVRYTDDVQALWYLRGDLMYVLAESQGEAAAREQLKTITALFADLLPKGLRARPSPLGSASRSEDSIDLR